MWLTGVFKNMGDKKLGVNEFHRIFLEYHSSLVFYATTFVDDVEVAKDIVQEVLVRFWTESEKLRNKEFVKPYLYKSVKNRALNHKKRESKKTALDELFDQFEEGLQHSENTDTFSVVSFEDLKVKLDAAIAELPEQRQKIFKMSRFQQMQHKEIALILDISPKTVETQIYRSLQFLRTRLKHYIDR